MSSEDEKFESDFWGSCTHTLEEELKHFVYARLMGLQWVGSGPKLDNYGWDVGGKKIFDIGGGPVSMLLRTVNLGRGVVVDPLKFPPWVYERYKANKISAYIQPAETADRMVAGPRLYDEVWIYNVLQHVTDPAKIIANAKYLAPVLRIFEWIDLPVYPGHPHSLSQAKLEEWIGQKGQTVFLNESGCNGRAFYGTFTHTPLSSEELIAQQMDRTVEKIISDLVSEPTPADVL